MCLGRKDSANLTGPRDNHKSSSKFLRGPNSRSSTSQPEDRFGVRGSQCGWPVRNGSPSPWLQRYKVKKRATTSYALQNSAQNCNEEEIERRPKRSQKYVNLSNAVILDAF